MLTALSAYILYQRYVRPSVYNRYVHILSVIFESQLFVFTFFYFLHNVSLFNGQSTALVYYLILGFLLAFLIIFAIDRKE